MDSIPWKHILGDKLAGAERVDMHPIVEAALVVLETNGLSTQGLFRVPGSASQVKALKESFKTKKKVPDLSETDPNTVCSLLTDHLRSEEPLLTHALAPRWLQAAGLPDLVVRLTKYVDLINQLPVLNHATLFAILRLLVLIAQHAEKTLMPATNLGTIFGPMICRRLNSDIAQELSDIPAVSKLCIDLITHFSQLFDYYDLDPSASGAGSGGGGGGGLNDSLSVDSPRTKKTTRRKFQFGKDKPFHGERSGERSSGGTSSPGLGSSAGGSGSPASSSPSSTSVLAAAAMASGSSNSPVVPLQSPAVPAPEYEPSATDGGAAGENDEGGRDQPGRARKNAVYGREERSNDQLKSELGEGGQLRSPKSARGLLGSISLDADEDDSRPESGTKLDGKSVMRSLSSMGGFYAKNVSKPMAVGDLETAVPSSTAAAAQPDAEEVPEEEGKDADGKKDKKRLPALNLKKRKNSIDKKKLRMFSPRKLFDKDRSKASPDSSCDSSDLERKYYDGSSSSEREEPTRRFGGRKIPFRSPRRKSSSWPEAELAEMRRAEQAASHDDDSDLNDDDSDSDDDDDGSGADSSGAGTPTSTSSSSSLAGGSEPKSRAKSDIPPGESHSLEIAAVVRTERRKGSQSERGPSASARAAARAGKSLAGASSATSISPRGKRPDLADGDERPLSSSTSNAPKLWMASAPRPPNATTSNILLLKSPRIVGAAVSAAAALDEAIRSQETITGHLAPEEELGLVKWRRRMTAGSARRRPAGHVHEVAVKGGGSENDGEGEAGETEDNDRVQRQVFEAPPTTGVAFLLSKYYNNDNKSKGGDGAEGSSNGVDAKPTAPPEREREKESRERDGGSGAESEGDTENDDEADDDGATTTEDEGSGGSGNGSSHGGSSGDEKAGRRRNSGAAAEGKSRRRRSNNSSARKNGIGSGGSNKKATTAVKKDSSGLKLGRKVRRGEEQVSENEEDGHHLAPPGKASPITKRIHSPRPRPSEDHIGGAGGNSITID